ncbi:MAG: 4Fe-4S dicluster domain-containing protein [Bacillota bacterium]
MKILAKNKLNEAIEILAKDARVLVPMNVNGVSKFAPWGSTGTLEFDAVNTLLPPKDVLFPNTEKMYSYKIANQEVAELTVHNEAENQVIFGLRPCDMQSIKCMDDVFLTKTFVDEFYKTKRENLTTVCIGCTKPAPTCFCDSMGLNPGKHEAADVQMYDLGDSYGVEAQTEAGQALVNKWHNLLSEGEVTIPEVSCTLKVDMTNVPQKLAKMFESDVWKNISRKCIGCGTCTYVCPTCYCFDIDVKNGGNEGYRFRCWDSCMFSEYTRMAGGHNPRPSKKERIRNRFLHKLEYFNERYGKNLCVGCGRCVAKCPVNVDITLFIDQLKEVPVNE